MDLAGIKAHPYYPFRNFRSDDIAFLMLEMYWAELFREVVGAGGDERVAAWRPAAPADREDGNPILSVIDRTTKPVRALRLVQRFNVQELVALDLDHLGPTRFRGDAYVPFVPDLTAGATDDDGITPADELVISSDLSDVCERLARALIAKWCVERVDPSAMRQILDGYWSRVRDCLIELP